METAPRAHDSEIKPTPTAKASNDNTKPRAVTSRAFPEEAVARIYKPSRSVLTSGKGRTSGWRLAFERRTPPVIEPLMGYTGSDDALTQVELTFPTLNSALRYAERQGLKYTVRRSNERHDLDRQRTDQKPAEDKGSSRTFSDQTLDRLGLETLQDQYGEALAGAERRSDPNGPEDWAWPMAVVRDPTLTLEAKRSILMNWAWTEYLIEQASNEGMPENGRTSRLHEVEQALLALERDNVGKRDEPDARQAA